MDRLFPEIVGNFRKLPESSAISGNFVKKIWQFPAIATQTFRCHSWSLCNDTLDHIGFLVIW